MSSKFWSKVLEASIDNIESFQPQIEEDAKHEDHSTAITFKYLSDRQLRFDYDVTCEQLNNIAPQNSAMILPNDDQPLVIFKEVLRDELDIFHSQLMEEYELLNEYISAEVCKKLLERKKHEEVEINQWSYKVGDVALKRDELKVITSNNDRWLTCLHRYRVKVKAKHRIFNAWKKLTQNKRFSNYNERKIKQALDKRIMRRVLDAWRSDVHKDYKLKQIELEPTYYQQRKTEVIDEWDHLIEGLRGYIDQLQQEIKVEVGAKHELIKVYESAMNGSVKKFQNANEFVNTQINEYRQSVNYDTFGRADPMKSTKGMDIGRITLTQQVDPEEEESKR